MGPFVILAHPTLGRILLIHLPLYPHGAQRIAIQARYHLRHTPKRLAMVQGLQAIVLAYQASDQAHIAQQRRALVDRQNKRTEHACQHRQAFRLVRLTGLVVDLIVRAHTDQVQAITLAPYHKATRQRVTVQALFHQLTLIILWRH